VETRCLCEPPYKGFLSLKWPFLPTDFINKGRQWKPVRTRSYRARTRAESPRDTVPGGIILLILISFTYNSVGTKFDIYDEVVCPFRWVLSGTFQKLLPRRLPMEFGLLGQKNRITWASGVGFSDASGTLNVVTDTIKCINFTLCLSLDKERPFGIRKMVFWRFVVSRRWLLISAGKVYCMGGDSRWTIDDMFSQFTS